MERPKLMRSWLALLFSAILVSACGDSAQQQQSVEDFYRGKTVTIVVGSSVGGGYDTGARMVARHLGKHIPGHPSVIVENMPGAGSILAANHLYNSAPKDGTFIGTFVDAAPLAPLWRQEGARYDPREIPWLGALSSRAQSAVVVMRNDSKVKSLADAKRVESALGSAGGPFATTTIYPKLLNELLGTKFKIITGYPGGAEVILALERGELEGYAGISWPAFRKEHPDWFAKDFLVPIVQMTLHSDPELTHVPLAINAVTDETDRKVMELVFGMLRYSRIFSAPPGIPEMRLKALRDAFAAMLADPAFLKEADVVVTEGFAPSSYAELEAFIREAYAAPEEVRARAAKYMGGT